MTTRILILVSFAVFIISCSSDDNTLVKIKLNNSNGIAISLDEMRLSGNRELETKSMNRLGIARFKVKMSYPGYYQLRFDNGISMVMVLLPGDKVEIRADMDSFHESKQILGSPFTERVASLHNSLRVRTDELNTIERALESADSLSINFQYKIDSLTEEYLSIRNAHRKYTQTFILEDLKSLANVAALYQEYSKNQYVLYHARDIQFFKLVSDTLTKYYPRVKYVRALKENYESIFIEYQRSKLIQMATPVEEDVPDLTLPGPGNTSKRLSALRGKTLLISFWSIRNPESLKNTIALKKVYKKYASQGFEIYQVSLDKSIAAWENTLSFEEIPWVSVIDTAFPNSKTQMFYNVNSIPLNYLINATQTEILAKNITPEMLDKALPEVLKNN